MQKVVDFDEIPTIKDSKPSLHSNNQAADPQNKIDFFGVEDDLNKDEYDDEDGNDILNPNDFQELEREFQ